MGAAARCSLCRSWLARALAGAWAACIGPESVAGSYLIRDARVRWHPAESTATLRMCWSVQHRPNMPTPPLRGLGPTLFDGSG